MRKLVPILVMAVCAFVPVLASRGILVGYAQTASTLQGDEFNASSFTAPFVVKCGSQAVGTCPDAQSATTWSLNGVDPGFLRIVTQPGSLVGSNADLSNNARNLVLQGVVPSADYTVTTKVTFPGPSVGTFTPLGQTAGLLVYQDDDHFIYLGRTFTAAKSGQSQIEFRQEDGSTELVNAVTETAPVNVTVYLRLVKTGTLYQASYSYDNVTFTPVPAGIAPTPTAVPTNTPVVTATATSAAIPTATTVPVATATSTALPVGYTASYQAPQVGLFAWGGINGQAINNQVPADFDWFRVGANSQTPVPTATTTNTPVTTSTATNTPVVTATATSTIPPLPTLTSTPTATATNTAIPTATAIPTNTPTPHKPKPKFGFSYVSVWYHYINIGHVQHIQVQAKIHARQGIWVTVHFATGKTIRYFKETDSRGFWATTFRIPAGTISAKSNQAVVTFQLWKGHRTTKSFSSFRVLR